MAYRVFGHQPQPHDGKVSLLDSWPSGVEQIAPETHHGWQPDRAGWLSAHHGVVSRVQEQWLGARERGTYGGGVTQGLQVTAHKQIAPE